MLPRKRRVSKKQFPRSFSGQAIKTDIFLMRFVKQKNSFGTRFSCVVSKKIAKTSVSRNKLRRRFYTALEKFLSDIKPGYLVIFHPSKESLNVSQVRISENIKDSLKKANLL
jgi:ribonuclease P protein component